MTTGLDYSQVAPAPHRCPRPKIRTWDEGATARGEDVFATIRILPDDTRFTCPECSTVWVVTTIPWQFTAHTATAPRHVWEVETRKQRRKRLGLRWWQR